MTFRRFLNTLGIVGMVAVMSLVAANGYVTDHQRWAGIAAFIVFITTLGGGDR